MCGYIKLLCSGECCCYIKVASEGGREGGDYEGAVTGEQSLVAAEDYSGAVAEGKCWYRRWGSRCCSSWGSAGCCSSWGSWCYGSCRTWLFRGWDQGQVATGDLVVQFSNWAT